MGAGPRQLHVRMRGRSSSEAHRASSPLELLFDLTFVVAVSSIAAQLAHGIVTGQLAVTIGPYLMVFFAIWWAWMNFTWFASAFDTDDAIYRVFTLVQMAGVLVIAAGVPAAVVHSDFTAITIGYVVMRIALSGQWIRAGVENRASRRPAFNYAAGVLLVQVGWVVRLLLLPPAWGTSSFVVLALAELAVPIWAEWRTRTVWHPGHIAERYALFVIILLGESVAAATLAMQRALAVSGVTPQLIAVGLAGLVVLFALWWLYFLEPAERGLRARPRWSYFWGYGHYLLFAGIAAIGAGLEVAVESAGHESGIGGVAVGYALAVPVAVVLVLLYVLHRPLVDEAEVPGRVLLPAAALTLLLPLTTPALGVAGMVVALAVLAALVVVVAVLMRQRRAGDEAAEHPSRTAD
jgi:low temperature requirement protein LtrA